MSPINEGDSLTAARFPRVSGDEPMSVDSLKSLRSFSPRERG